MCVFVLLSNGRGSGQRAGLERSRVSGRRCENSGPAAAEGAFERVFPETLGDARGVGRVEEAHGDTDHQGWCGESPEAEVMNYCAASFQNFPEPSPTH